MAGVRKDGILQVDDVNLDPDVEPIPVIIGPSSVATESQVADSASSVTILAANTGRRGASIINTSTATLFLRLSSSAATVTNYTVALVQGAYYEVPFGYTGEITGIWSSDPGNGNANVTEFTA